MPYSNAELLRDKNGNPIPQYFNVATGKFEPITGDNGAQKTQLTGSNVEQIVLQKTPETLIVFNEVVENPENVSYKIIHLEDVPKNVQSIAISLRKNSQTFIETDYSFRQSETTVYSKVNEWIDSFFAITPVLGDTLRLRIRRMHSTTQPVVATITYFYAPQGQENSEEKNRLDNLEHAITSLGGSV